MMVVLVVGHRRKQIHFRKRVMLYNPVQIVVQHLTMGIVADSHNRLVTKMTPVKVVVARRKVVGTGLVEQMVAMVVICHHSLVHNLEKMDVLLVVEGVAG
jgi:hypothetical protein